MKLVLVLVFVLLFGLGPQTFSQSTTPTDSQIVLERFLGTISDKNNTLIDLLVNEQPKEQTRRALILHFCDVMLGVNEGNNLAIPQFTFDTMSYDPKKSMFMYALCVNMDKEMKGHKNYQEQFKAIKTFDMQKYLKEEVKDINKVRGIPKQSDLDSESSYSDCNPKTSMMRCNMSSFTLEIFSKIMNDLSNLKLASIYGVKYGSGVEARMKAISDFSKVFFQDPEHPEYSCQTNGENVIYLNPKQIPDGSKQHCSHPKTFKYLDQMIASAHTLADKKTERLNGKEFIEKPCSNFQDDFYACAMSSSGAFYIQNSQSAFQNILLNEMMRYNLFLAYYKGMIKMYANYRELNFLGLGNNIEEDNYEQITISNQQALTQKAVWQMNRQLTALYATFPLHIGLLAYYEDMIYMRKTLTTLYTPLHQLFYKLRNAQERDA